ncbi:MAG: TolC family protein, partial [Desulfovibrio sp.]|nr:TolC family protein [Desulfovibrio sp.]
MAALLALAVLLAAPKAPLAASREAPAPVYKGRVLGSGGDAAPAGALDMAAAVARALERNPSLGAQEAQ